MQEAWFLFDKAAIREAADNPNGSPQIDLPPIRVVEDLPEPKMLLLELLSKASGLSGRRLKSFDARKHFHRLAQIIEDYSPLRMVPAFKALEVEIKNVLQENGWE
jgi:hypothetical protein